MDSCSIQNLMFSYENTSLLPLKHFRRIYSCPISLLINGASGPSESFALVKWMSPCFISIMFVRTNINTSGEIWPGEILPMFSQKIWFWMHLIPLGNLILGCTQIEMFHCRSLGYREKWLFIQCLSFNIALGTTCLQSPPPLVLYCCWGVAGVSAVVVICFGRWSHIYLWLSYRKDVGKHSALTACRFLVCLHWFSFFPFCWSCKIS